MGLDVGLHTNIKEVEISQTNHEDGFEFYNMKEWEGRMTKYDYNKVYRSNFTYGMVSYSYSSHSTFRRILFYLLTDNRDDLEDNTWMDIDTNDKTIPFLYLFDFTDCEGCFDYTIGKILLSNFEQYKDKVDALDDNDFKLFKFRYQDWYDMLSEMGEDDIIDFR